MAEFLAMGGYAWYVWPAYLVTFVVLVANLVAARNRYSHLRKRLINKLRREERRSQ